MSVGKVFAIINVHSGIAWPREFQRVAYAGREIQLVPPKPKGPGEFYDTYPIAVGEGTDRDDAAASVPVVRQFLNAIAWREQTYVREVGLEVTSWAHRQAVQVLGNDLGDNIDASSLVAPTSREARLSLAFYREGLSLEHIGYQFLSFFKVLNIQLANGSPQIAWLNSNHIHVVGGDARKRLDELLAAEPDLGKYLYVSGRCAVAHAFNKPLIDPDNVEDDIRLRSDLPLIRELAAIRMQRDFGIAAPRRAV